MVKVKLFCLLTVFTLAAACSKKQEVFKPEMSVSEPVAKTVTGYFHFQYYFGEKPLQFDSVFTNSFGQKFKFDTISFFLSDLTLTKENGTSVIVKSNPLFENHLSNLSQNLLMKNVPTGDYMSVSFLLGVDSELNKVSTFGLESDFLRYKDNVSGHGFLFISGHLLSNPTTRLSYMIGTNELLRIVTLPRKPFTIFENQPYFFHYNVDLSPLITNLNFDNDLYTNSIENKDLAVSIADNILKIFSYASHH